MTMRVLVSDNLSEHGLSVLRDNKEIELDYQPGLNEEALAEAIVGASALIIRSGSRVTARVLVRQWSLLRPRGNFGKTPDDSRRSG